MFIGSCKKKIIFVLNLNNKFKKLQQDFKNYLSAIVPVVRAVRKAETRVPETRTSCHVSDRDISLSNQSINQRN